MDKTKLVIGLLFIVGIFVIGVLQTVSHARGSSLAGAMTLNAPRTQQEIGICVRNCMLDCVKMEGMEPQCQATCNTKCDAP